MANQIEMEVPPSLDGERLDKAIAQLLDVSRAAATRTFDDGVLLDGARARSSDRVRTGQVIRCAPPDEDPLLQPEEVRFSVLYEDDSVIVVDKPAGIVVHPGSGRAHGTLAAGLIYRFPELEGVGAAGRWGLVHRLDRDTSGALLVARTSEAYDSLSAEMRRRRISRTYAALVEGKMEAPTGTIDANIGRDPVRPTRRAITHGGKPARTHYEVVSYYQESDLSLLELRLETGRTHQIRVHMGAIGHPVVGDLTYGATRRDLDSPRTFLHATKLEFDHPVTRARVGVEAPLPPDLVSMLERLPRTGSST